MGGRCDNKVHSLRLLQKMCLIWSKIHTKKGWILDHVRVYHVGSARHSVQPWMGQGSGGSGVCRAVVT